MAALGLTGLGVGDPEADDAELRVVGEGPAAQFGRVVVGQQAVVVQEEQDVDVGAAGAEGLDADVAAAGDAEVLGQLDGPDPAGTSGTGEPLPTTTTSTRSPSCLATESRRALSSSGRLPMVMITAPTFVAVLT